MRKHVGHVVTTVLLLSSCATVGSDYFSRGNPYGAPRPYGLHPGIDFMIDIGTPVIAAADGRVNYTRNNDGPQPWQGGFIMHVSHGEHIDAVYMHLSTVVVESGQPLKRGQLIGLSGASTSGHAHLHFGICRRGANCFAFSDTHDPDQFWLGGRQQCYQPRTDYPHQPQRDLTLPLACGDYARELISQIKSTGAR